MTGQEGKPVPATNWTLRYEDVAPRKEGPRGALCMLGNGYFATCARLGNGQTLEFKL